MEKILVTQSSMPPYEEYIKAIKPLWESHWLTNMGKYHQKFEEELKEFLDVPEVSLMVNGHMALELTIQSFGFPEDSEVITTPFTFISTTHAIIRNHLIPVFCDVKLEDGTLDDEKIERLITSRTVAIVPVHVYGHVCNIEKIQEIADKYHLKVIYDAAHAFGVKYKGKGIGNFGDASIFSFHATKVFNSIEGGAVTFSESDLYEKLQNLKNFGIRSEELTVEVGTNAKMNEFCAIMGLCNLKHISEVINKRREKIELYKERLKEIKGIKILEGREGATNNCGYFPILIEKEYGISRNELYDILRGKGVFTRKYFYPLTSEQACFHNKFKMSKLNCAKKLSEEVLVLPLYTNLDNVVIEEIVEIIREKGNEL